MKYKEYAQSMSDFYGEIVMKQIQDKEADESLEFGKRIITEIPI